MMVALRSWKYGLISLVPNMIPAIMGFGVWALIIGQAGFAISTVASVTIGIIVDDTVHFLSKYVLYRRDEKLSAAEAIRTTFGTVGPALVMTTVILLVGFSVLAMSDFRLNWTLGLLSATTVGIALLVDFILLPAILAVVDGRGEKETSS